MITTDQLVTKIEDEAPRVVLECPDLQLPRTELVVVEGDVALGPDDVIRFAAPAIEIAKRVAEDPDAEKQGLLGMERDGQLLRWRPGRQLTYCVRRPTFDTEEMYQVAVAGMKTASADWSGICGVEFTHVESLDRDTAFTPNEVDFPVVRQMGNPHLVALAFFPTDPADKHVLWSTTRSTVQGRTPTTRWASFVTLGHVLGFRHEHIRPEAPDLFYVESTEHTQVLSDYDPQSVMHYVGEGVGDRMLMFTDVDKAGARNIYGGPYREYSFVD